MDKKDLLKEITEKYWESYEPTDIDRSLERYLEPQEALDGQSLLEAEMKYAYAKGKIEVQPCNTLVMMVGYSLEPLLQSVCVYRPKKVVLLLNEDGYDFPTGNKKWHVFARHLIRAVDLLVGTGIEVDGERITQRPQFPGPDEKKRGYPVADSPEAVFQKLVEVLHDEKDVVIDVTGGKKSMTSGAYMYAAYAGARISYVDFDEYDPKRRRPYGYSCKIKPLKNPYQAFALREWERVRALYKRYQFREARRILDGEVLPAMEQWQPEAVSAVRCLGRVLEFYEKWDSGDFHGAYQYANSQLPLEFPKPSAVTKLGPRWYKIVENRFVQTPSHFYGDSEDVKVYVCDELARIKRLIEYNEDYRSAFLRAGGLNEIVILTRLVALVSDPTERQSLLNPLDERTPSAEKVFKALLDPAKTSINVKKDIPFKNAPNLTISRSTPMNSWWKSTGLFGDENGWEVFLTRRNELIHKYFSVTPEWADSALAFVKANVEDFWGKRVEEMGVQTNTLPWRELCKLTRIDRFLPPNLRKED